MHTKIGATAIALLIAATAVGCGGSDKPKASAYDASFLKKIEGEVRADLEQKAEEGDDIVSKELTVNCSADNDRAFTCDSVSTIEAGGIQCAEVPTTQRGSLDPKTGKSSWKTVKVDPSNTISCD